ncbi:unnamed protein product [Mytilus edulis]|uniref:Integrase catalytic domain-containing protein n=1 Tax=Mytilus edulis TaxID=6550 RepID=A0A8S3RS87_MYTED|nr:unnamed protein product [Mytilus edulis]
MLHDDPVAGHFGIHRTLARVSSRFYWAGYKETIEIWCKCCEICSARKGPTRHPRGPMKQYLVGAPLERVAIDILGPLPETKNKNKYILVITDYFSRWAESYPMPDQEAETVTRIFVSEFIARFGLPRQVHTDQGRQFESHLFRSLCQTFKMDKTRTTALHPQSDGMVERLNRTIEDILSKFIAKDQRDWDLHLPLAMMAYRSSVHESTGYSPSMLMFGREIELPVDLLYGQPPQISDNITHQYLAKLIPNLWRIHNIAREKMAAASNRQKQQYDHKIYAHQYKVGDAVWVYNPSKAKGKSPKLQCKWTGPYLIIAVFTDLIYKIQKSEFSREIIIHHDRMKPFIGSFDNWLLKSNNKSSVSIFETADESLYTEEPEKENADHVKMPRRSNRHSKPPDRFSS